nr:MAG TPA: hypothetical protein [Caudoviricetes sp.]
MFYAPQTHDTPFFLPYYIVSILPPDFLNNF